MAKYEMQMLNWHIEDVRGLYPSPNFLEPRITGFGKLAEGHSVAVHFTDIEPYLVYKAPEDRNINEYMNSLRSIMELDMPEMSALCPTHMNIGKKITINTVSRVENHKAKPYHNWSSKKIDVVRLYCPNIKAFQFLKRMLTRKYSPKTDNGKDQARVLGALGFKSQEDITMYETTMTPLLRFFHETEIRPCGWISISKDCKLDQSNIELYNKMHKFPHIPNVRAGIINFVVSVADIGDKWFVENKASLAPHTILSFDIECSSFDKKKFPTACGKYLLVPDMVRELITTKDIPSIIQKLIVFLKSPYEEERVLWGFHRRQLMPYEENMQVEEVLNNDSFKNHLVHILCSPLSKNIDDTRIFDMTCSTLDEWFVKHFCGLTSREPRIPKPAGDVITQIGLAVQHIGESEIEKCLISLGECAKIEDAEVISCKTEKDLLQTFVNKLNDINPDIVTGYNITGFDFAFIMDRAGELNIYNCSRDVRNDYQQDKSKDKTTKRINDDEGGEVDLNAEDNTIPDEEQKPKKIAASYGLPIAKLKDQSTINGIEPLTVWQRYGTRTKTQLSSAAYGDNNFDYIDMPGRTMFDLVKHMRKEYTNLDSYKLDAVAETYITGKGKWIGDNKVELDDPRGLQKNNFIKIEDIKYKILNINGKIVELNETLRYVKEVGEKIKFGLVKDDISVKDIFDALDGSPDHRAMVGAYCIMDCVLVIELINKLSVMANTFAMANTCIVPLEFIYIRGQGIRSYSLLVNECNQNEFVLPESKRKSNSRGYEGAIVSNPVSAIFDETPVAVLDYSSLYPSCMISENISHETVLPSFKEAMEAQKQGYKVNIVQFVEEDGISRNMYFVDNNSYVGLLPATLKKLLKARKDTRKKMKDPNMGDFDKAILNGQQLAFKVCANSIYGITGTKTSPLYYRDLAAATTAKGREMLDIAQVFTQKKYGCKLIYGDSVTPDTPIMLKNIETNEIEIKTIETIHQDEWSQYEEFKPNDSIESNRREKQQSKCSKYQVWNDNGWTNINRVIRHKCNKKIYQITTHTGVVRVTEDHSLLDENKHIVKPNNVNIGMKLLSSYPTNNNITIPRHFDEVLDFKPNTLEEKEAYIMGMFMTDGSCGFYKCPSGDKYSWGINNATLDRINYFKELCNEVYGKYTQFKVLETMKSSGVRKLVPKGSVKYMVNLYRDMFYDKDKHKIIPTNILNANEDIRFAFFTGFYQGDGAKITRYAGGKYAVKHLKISQKGQIAAANLYYLIKSLGYECSINTRADKPEIFKISATIGKLRKPHNIIKKIEVLYDTYDDYVYDIETVNGRFNAGIGEITVKNTDSIFVIFPEARKIFKEQGRVAAIKYTIDMGVKVNEDIKELMRAPHDLEYEQTLFPLIMFSKKRYIGKIYEFDPENHEGMKLQGVVLKRRDNARFTKIIYNHILENVLQSKSPFPELAYDLEEMRAGRMCEFNELIISKKLAGSYKSKPAHAELADRINAVEQGKIEVGDRIPFLFIKTGMKVQKQCDQIQLAEKLLEQYPGDEWRQQIDYDEYIDKVIPPAMQLLEYCLKYKGNEEDKYYTLIKPLLIEELFIGDNIDPNSEIWNDLYKKWHRQMSMHRIHEYMLSKAEDIYDKQYYKSLEQQLFGIIAKDEGVNLGTDANEASYMK